MWPPPCQCPPADQQCGESWCWCPGDLSSLPGCHHPSPPAVSGLARLSDCSHSNSSNLLAGHWADRESIIEMIRASLPFWDWDNARQCAEMRSTPPTLSSPVFSRLPRLGQVITAGGCYKYFLLYRESYALVKVISCLSRVSFLVKDIVGMHFSYLVNPSNYVETQIYFLFTLLKFLNLNTVGADFTFMQMNSSLKHLTAPCFFKVYITGFTWTVITLLLIYLETILLSAVPVSGNTDWRGGTFMAGGHQGQFNQFDISWCHRYNMLAIVTVPFASNFAWKLIFICQKQ